MLNDVLSRDLRDVSAEEQVVEARMIKSKRFLRALVNVNEQRNSETATLAKTSRDAGDAGEEIDYVVAPPPSRP